MKKFVTVVCALASISAVAQEIGTEIPPGQQTSPSTSSGQTNYDNPYGQPATTTTTTTTTQTGTQAAPAAAATIPGPRKGTFGIRASFNGGSVGLPATGPGAVAAPAGTFSLRYLATDTMAVDFDVGLGLGIVSSRVLFGFAAGFGITAYMGSPEKPIRPFFTGGLSFGKGVSQNFDGVGMSLYAGGGGEYWFNDHFSLDGKVLVGIPIAFTSNLALSSGTFMPGVGANFYF